MKQKRMKGELRKQSILEAALETIAENNFEKATTVLIAKAAGVTEPLIYTHFGTKRNLQLAVMDHIHDQLLGIIKILELKPEVSLAQMRQGGGKQLQTQIANNPSPIKVLIKALAQEDSAIQEKAWNIILSTQQAVLSILENARKNGEVMPDLDAEMMAWAIFSWAWMLSVVNALGKDKHFPQDKIDSFVQDLDVLLLRKA